MNNILHGLSDDRGQEGIIILSSGTIIYFIHVYNTPCRIHTNRTTFMRLVYTFHRNE